MCIAINKIDKQTEELVMSELGVIYFFNSVKLKICEKAYI